MNAGTLNSIPILIEFPGQTLFDLIASDLLSKGFSIKPLSLPCELSASLYRYAESLDINTFKIAGTGRNTDYQLNQFVRTDSIFWLTGRNEVERNWLNWCGQLQTYLNRKLFLGLRSFESHFACYQQGQFYKRHCDAFKGESNRILSLVVYLNPDCHAEDAGELVLYKNQQDDEGIKIRPDFGTIVVFLSEEFPHEVRPTHKTRLSVAGWFSQ